MSFHTLFGDNGSVAYVAYYGAKCFYVAGITRPVCLPDLTVPDFFLCGYLKEHEYTVIAQTQYRS
jgi:hypothetical protein